MTSVDAHRPVILVGMMGSGKSTVGKRLAAALGREFVDADKEIEARCGVPVSTIFELEGEDGFRRREQALLDELTRRPGLVLATGGGAVLRPENREVLRSRGLVVYLSASAHELWMRLRNDKVRPLLRTPDPRRRIGELVALREPMYRECAQLTVSTGRQPVDRVVDEILKRMGKRESSVRELEVSLAERSYRILIGDGLRRRADLLAPFVAGRQVALVTNPTVGALYGADVTQALAESAAEVIQVALPDGEQYKTQASLNLILDALLGRRFDRRSVIVALGGGVIGDIAGFAAAIYQRGIDFIQMPTTLLAQVDSSVGGKTAINHPLGKNMIGAFHQPRLVIADVGCLATLPDRELSAGLAEVIKHGAIADVDYLGAVERALPAMLAHDTGVLAEIVEGSCRIKSRVVAADEREEGVRATLNFGHTFGHAIEAGMGYGEWLHGEAVGTGMVMAADLSVRLGLLDEAARARLLAAVAAARLPLRGPRWTPEHYLALMSGDKKSERGTPRFVVLTSLGVARLQRAPDDAVRATLETCVEPV